MSLHRLSAGAGLRYLVRDTASADVARPAGTGLGEYYAATGNPPGHGVGLSVQPVPTGDRLDRPVPRPAIACRRCTTWPCRYSRSAPDQASTEQVRRLFSTFSDWTPPEVEAVATAADQCGGRIIEHYRSVLHDPDHEHQA